MNVEVGKVAPQFTLLDQDGERWSLKDHRGAPVVLYFYPKDDTPGCTKQACDVREHWAEFTDLGVTVAGISPDDHHSHKAFAARHGLPHTLLADTDRKVAAKYGAWGEKSMYGKKFMGIVRSAFLVDEKGKIEQAWPKVSPKDTVTNLLKAIKG